MSEAVNPYAAPRAAVADVYEDEAGTQPVKWFSAKGRVGRLRYLARTFVGYLLLLAGVFGLSVVAGLTGAGAAVGGVIGFLAVIPYFLFLILLTIQRSHDMGWTGWTAILASSLWWDWSGSSTPGPGAAIASAHRRHPTPQWSR